MEDSFGKTLFFPLSPFLSRHSLWMVVQRGGWWVGFDLHAHLHLVQHTNPAARDRDDLIRKQVDVDALDPVRLHVLEAT